MRPMGQGQNNQKSTQAFSVYRRFLPDCKHLFSLYHRQRRVDKDHHRARIGTLGGLCQHLGIYPGFLPGLQPGARAGVHRNLPLRQAAGRINGRTYPGGGL